jgi:hypothetical protein
MKHVIDRLPERFRWSIHNLIAHPVGEVMHQVGRSVPRLAGRLEGLEGRLHDGTIPTHERGQGRG